MFCNQCEQTAKGTGCTVMGVCGKLAPVADLQDHVIYALRLLSRTAQGPRQGRDRAGYGRLYRPRAVLHPY